MRLAGPVTREMREQRGVGGKPAPPLFWFLHVDKMKSVE